MKLGALLFPNRYNRLLALLILALFSFPFFSCSVLRHFEIGHRGGTDPEELESETDEDPDARNDWFLFQRLYPRQFIPPDARRAAYQRVLDQRRLEAQLQPLAGASGWRS